MCAHTQTHTIFTVIKSFFPSIRCALYNSCYNTIEAAHSLVRLLVDWPGLCVSIVCLWRWTAPRMDYIITYAKSFKTENRNGMSFAFCFPIQIRAYKQYISHSAFAVCASVCVSVYLHLFLPGLKHFSLGLSAFDSPFATPPMWCYFAFNWKHTHTERVNKAHSAGLPLSHLAWKYNLRPNINQLRKFLMSEECHRF